MRTEIEWSYVKKKTLWQYEELIAKIKIVLSYNFVKEYYNHSMKQAAVYSGKLQKAYLLNGKETGYISEIREDFLNLNEKNIKNYQNLIEQVSTRERCESFIRNGNIPFESLIRMLNFLMRWILPFAGPVRELVESKKEEHLAVLKKDYKVRNNLDILENWGKKEKRETLIEETGLNERFILKLVNRADISRLAFVRAKTIRYLCESGYDSLQKIANADIKQMETDMDNYFKTIGKRYSTSKKVIPLDWMIGGAKVLPKVIEK